MEIFRRQEVPEPENEQIPAARLQTDDTVLCPGDYAPQTALRRTTPVVAMIEIKFARNDLFQAGPICFRFPNRNSGKGWIRMIIHGTLLIIHKKSAVPEPYISHELKHKR